MTALHAAYENVRTWVRMDLCVQTKADFCYLHNILVGAAVVCRQEQQSVACGLSRDGVRFL